MGMAVRMRHVRMDAEQCRTGALDLVRKYFRRGN